MIRRRFMQDLENLNESMLKMGTINEQAISIAIRSLESREYSYKDVRELEIENDSLERSITSDCMEIILSQQPVAGDLRVITTAMRMVTDMERIADQCVDIAEIAQHLAKQPPMKIPGAIGHMADKATKMVSRSIDAYVQRDVELAQIVIGADDEVDAMFMELREEVITMIHDDAANGHAAIDFIMIAKYLERIADHAVNIAEWVIFLITGHHKEKPLAAGAEAGE